MPKVITHYARVSTAVDLVLTMRVSADATKSDIKRAAQKALNSLVDAEDGITIPCRVLPTPEPRVYPPKKSETTDKGTIFTLKGLEVLDVFTGEEDAGPTFS